MNDLIQRGLKEPLIKFDDNDNPTRITYIQHDITRRWANPEEKVQAETYIKLVLDYYYPPELMDLFVSVTMGSEKKQADIIVYKDESHKSPYIVIECKKQEVSEAEFAQATNQAFSYAVAEGARYVWTTSGLKDEYYQVEDKRPKSRTTVSDIPRFGVEGVSEYKYAKGGIGPDGQPLSEIKAISEGELTRRFKQAHDALWGGGELHPSAAFDELDKLIFCKLWDEKKPRKRGEPYDFQIITTTNVKTGEDETDKSLKERVDALYEQGRRKEPEVFSEGIRLSPAKLRTIVSYLQEVNLSETDLDSKGKAFETFMGSFFRGDFGQFFTPRPIVKFIVDVLPMNNDSMVLDTSCGSGGFLLHALDKVRKQASEYHPDEAPTESKQEGKNHYKYWHDFAEKNLFGIEINEQIARVSKMNMIIHDDGHTNVVNADGLLPFEDIKDEKDNIILESIANKTGNRHFKPNSFDFIITNPPFGSIIRQTEKAYLHQYNFAWKGVHWLDLKGLVKSLRENQSTEVLFIEQAHNYLKDGGYLAIVIPDGILNTSSLQYVRDSIEEKFRIVAVVSMPQTAFQATGAGVKSSVMFLKKHTRGATEQITKHKEDLQEKIKKENDYSSQYNAKEDEKKTHLQELRGFDNSGGLEGKALRQSDEYKQWRKEVNAHYKGKIDELKESLIEQYLEQKETTLNDYPIFMAIAEDIGYDATGRDTGNNELEAIGKELKRFIESIEKGKV
ncbi:MAG: N-6 DNA methylase [Candidatus Dadabacteria bacterium]|nr:N-6 DNA methylase [Candidatus Dadabacteria bacterium]